jgi:predicted MFS family arabinose efflux permease
MMLVAGTFLAYIGQWAAYTFITPYYSGTLHSGQGLVSLLLVLYGLGGIAGNFFGGAFASRRIRPALITVTTALAALIAATRLLTSAPAGPAIAVTAWGLVFGGTSVTMQNWAFHAAPDQPEGVSAIVASAIRASIAIGAAVGGIVVDLAGIRAGMWFGAALVAAAAITVLFARFRHEPRDPAPPARPDRAGRDDRRREAHAETGRTA